MPPRAEESSSLGEEPTKEAMDRLQRRIKECDSELSRCGEPAFLAAKRMLLEEKDCPARQVLPVGRALQSLAISFRMMKS
jgi:hypothetical protein